MEACMEETSRNKVIFMLIHGNIEKQTESREVRNPQKLQN